MARVLVIDDDRAVRSILRIPRGRMGHRVATAEDGFLAMATKLGAVHKAGLCPADGGRNPGLGAMG